MLETLAPVSPRTRLMFGCLAVYPGARIVFVLRHKGDRDDGVWMATTAQHHESLRREFPRLRSIAVPGSGITGWQSLPADAPDFGESALRACELVIARDPRIGKTPKPKPRPAKTSGKGGVSPGNSGER